MSIVRYISIHALLAESDDALVLTAAQCQLFLSTLSLRRATLKLNQSQGCMRFLSTLSLRRATPDVEYSPRLHHNFYPRSPCGERLLGSMLAKSLVNFYPRSPCGERHISKQRMQAQALFLSTLSLRRATFDQYSTLRNPFNFYPRSPCGERLEQVKEITQTLLFLSTLSLRRAT